MNTKKKETVWKFEIKIRNVRFTRKTRGCINQFFKTEPKVYLRKSFEFGDTSNIHQNCESILLGEIIYIEA